MKTFLNLLLFGILGLLISCDSNDNINILGGSQSSIGDPSNTFTYSFIDGATNLQADIVDLTDGISTVNYSVDITDPTFLSWAGMVGNADLNSNTLTATRKYKITTEGIQSVFDDGSTLMWVQYDGDVGDKYTLDRGMTTITREIGRRSTEDDYFWGGWIIKTIDVETNEFPFPGVSYFEYFFNHRFGLVGVMAHFEDGSTRSINVFSNNSD